MSATGRSDVRLPDDWYKTPPWCTRAILPHLDIRPYSDTILDPCCGDGAILDVIADKYPKAPRFGFEIEDERLLKARERHPHTIVRDALGDSTVWALKDEALRILAIHGAPRFIITNPPYSLAMEFVQRARKEIRFGGTVAMLLRLPWLASEGRAPWLRENTPSVYVLPRRPEFAASVKCKEKCGFEVLLPIDAPRPPRCPKCGEKVTVTTSDATDYAWLVWNGKPPTVKILEVESRPRARRTSSP